MSAAAASSTAEPADELLKRLDFDYCEKTPSGSAVVDASPPIKDDHPHDNDDSWLNSIWEAIEFEIELPGGAEVEEVEDTIEVVPPEAASPKSTGSTVTSRFVTWEVETLPPMPLMAYPLFISPQDPRELATCIFCNRELAVVVLHDSSPQHLEPRVADLTCQRCHLGVDASVPLKITIQQNHEKFAPRKRKAEGPSSRVWCDVCHHLVAYGGMRLKSLDSGWHPVDFRVEYLCANCVPDFNVCSSCGGPGKYRKGKWKPRQMFPAGRRNCMLQHRMPAKPKFHVVSYLCPNVKSDASNWNAEPMVIGDGTYDPCEGLPPTDRLMKIADLMTEANNRQLLMNLAAPVMRRYPYLWRWDLILQQFEHIATMNVKFVMGSDTHPPYQTRKYALVGYLTAGNAPAGHSLRREDRVIIAFSKWKWHTDGKHVQLASCGYAPGTYSHPGSRAFVTRVERDASALGLALPKFFWGSHHKTAEDAHLEEFDHTNGAFISIPRYARERGLDAEEVRADLRIYANFVDFPFLKTVVLPWEARGQVGEQSN